jgi:hypothetical protein
MTRMLDAQRVPIPHHRRPYVRRSRWSDYFKLPAEWSVSSGFSSPPGELRGGVIAALTTLGKELDLATKGDTTAAVVAKLDRNSSIRAPAEPYVANAAKCYLWWRGG